MGWALAPRAHGRGLATEALREVVAWQRRHGFPMSMFTEASLDLDARYTVAAVRRSEHLETILGAQAAGPAVNGQRS